MTETYIWQEQKHTEQKRMRVSHFKSLSAVQNSEPSSEISQFPFFRPPTFSPNGPALGAINTRHFAVTLISQICSHRLAAATLLQDLSELFELYSSTYSDSLTGEEEEKKWESLWGKQRRPR